MIFVKKGLILQTATERGEKGEREKEDVEDVTAEGNPYLCV